GIRDRNVTGVQTCALPIWLTPAHQLVDLTSAVKERMAAVSAIYQRVIYQQQGSRDFPTPQGDFQLRAQAEGSVLDPSPQQLRERSEERRVGKECRSGVVRE